MPVADPFSDLGPPNLIGGENGSLEFQVVGGRFEPVPKAEVNTPTELGAFADLVQGAPSSRSMGYAGAFTDLIPKPQTETEAALAETSVEIQHSIDQQNIERNAGQSLEPLAKALDYAKTIGIQALSELSPEISARIFGATSGSLRKEELPGPIISPELAKSIVGRLPDWAGGNTPAGIGLSEGMASAISSFSEPGQLAILPAFAVPGVAETYVLDVLHGLPDQGKHLWDAIQQYGLNSKEVGSLAAQYGITDLTAFLAAKGGTAERFRTMQRAINSAPVRPASAPEPSAATTELPVEQTAQSDNPARRMVPVSDAAQSETATAPQTPAPTVDIPSESVPVVDEALQPESTNPAQPSQETGNDWTRATADTGGGMKLGGQEGGFVNLQDVADAVDTLKEKTGMKIEGKANDLNMATTARSAKLQTSFADAERAQKEINKVANERRQNAMSIWREAGGDATVLQDQLSKAQSKWFKQAATDALNLKPEEIAMTQKVGQTFDILEKRGNTYDVLTNHRDNYVPHVWDVSKKFTGIGSSKLQDRFKFNKARTFDTFFDGDQAGFTPKTLAIGKLLPAYLHEMNTVIADRQFVQDVSKGMSSEGTPLVIPRGRVSGIDTVAGGKAFLADPNAIHGMKDANGDPIDQSQYKTVDQPALSDWRWANEDAAGNPIFMKDDLAVHPELAKRLNAMMGQSEIRRWYNEPSKGLSTVPRVIAKGLDTTQSVMKREMFGLLAPFHQVQEGTHAIGHMVNPFFGLEDMSKPTAKHIDAMQNGLMLLPEKQSSAGYIEGVGGKNSFPSQIARKFGGPAGRMIANAIDGYQNYLFHQYIPTLKFKTYEHIAERNMGRYAKELKSGKVTEGDVKMLSAEQTNAAYGHLNYALLDRNPTIQHFLQLSLLAPDFLEARGRFAAQALKPSKAGFEQFRAIAVLAAAQAGTAIVLSKLIPGGTWDWQHPFELTVNGRTYTLRSVPEDLFRLLFSGPDLRREFVSARINPFAQKGIQALTGRNYRGEKTTFTDTMGELLANYIPITARSIPGIRQLTETSRNNPVSPLEQLAGSLGLKISRYSPITKTYQLATEWKKSVGLPVDTGSYPVSKYQQLRYALEDGDIEKAKAEYQKLRTAGMVPSKIASGFKESIDHPFTGTKGTDVKFSQSLNADGKNAYDMAVKRRRDILRKFGFMVNP